MVRARALPVVRLTGYTPPPAALRVLPEDAARQFAVVPLWLENNTLVVASAQPLEASVAHAVAAAARRPIRALSASYPDVRAALERFYRGAASASPHIPAPELGQALFHLGHLTEESLARARAAQAELRLPLAQVLLRLNLINENDLSEALGWQFNLPHLRLAGMSPQPHLAPLIPWQTARAQKIVPLWWLEHTLIVGAASPPDLDWRALSRLGIPLWLAVCPPTEWNRIYARAYLHGRAAAPEDDAAVVRALLKSRVLAEEALAAARAVAQQARRPLLEVLQSRGIVTRQQWLEARARVLGLRAGYTAPRRNGGSSAELAERVPAAVARRCALVPLERDHKREILRVGVANLDPDALRLIESLTELKVEARLLDEADLCARLRDLYGDDATTALPPVLSLAELLVGLGIVTPAQLQEADAQIVIASEAKQSPSRDFETLAPQASAGVASAPRPRCAMTPCVLETALADDSPAVGERLIELGYLDEFDLSAVLALQSGFPSTRLERARFDSAIVTRISPDLARRHALLPWVVADGVVWVVVADPFDAVGLQAIETALGLRAQPIVAPRSAILAAIERLGGSAAIQLGDAPRALVEALMQRGVLTNTRAAEALRRVAQGTPVDQALAQVSDLPARALTQTLAEYLGIAWVDLQLREETRHAFDALGQPITRCVVRDPVDGAAARRLDLETARRLSALPVARTDDGLVVAFADPLFEAARREIEQLLGMAVRPVLAPRAELDEAIQRVLGQQNIGTRLLLAGIISRGQLNDALDLAQRTGVRLGRALVNRGYVTPAQLSQFLAEQARLPFFDLRAATFDEAIVRSIDQDTERALGILPLAADASDVTLAMVDPLNDEAARVAARLTGRVVRPVLVSEQDLEDALERIYGGEYLGRSVSELLERAPDDSAYWVLSRGQKIALALIVLLSALWVVYDVRGYIILLNAFSTTFYLGFSAYKFYLAYRAMTHDLEVPVSDEEVAALDDRALPMYTILVPVYKEAAVLPDLLEAISKLDYPTTKLDVKVLMEVDDLETLQAFEALKMPPHFQGIVVPPAHPRTKPKACNYGLLHARGEYVVIYDAEDLPDPDQLKRVLVAFRKSAPNVVCVQSKLNYYNRNQNLLTAWFTVEYSMWFDLFLPGLDASGAPIPLGGTSNHFKRSALVEAGAWDPHNVTEDADLGVRVFKRGYRTAIVDSTTYEEANSQVYNWIRQRSRWIKGYIQTWLVHMRHPLKLYREVGFTAFWGFQFVVGGTFFAALLNPIYWFLTTLWFVAHWAFIQEVFPGIVFYSGALCLYVGNFVFTYLNVAGAMRRGYYDMVKYALLSPLYWGLMSVGAWKGFLQLVTKPYFWEKTRHGLFRGEPSTEKAERLRDLV